MVALTNSGILGMNGNTVERAVTLKDVAGRAGVSAITVSRAVNRPESVSPGLRARIDEAIAALGYRPNRLAGALASAVSPVIPVVVPSLSNIVFIEVIAGLQAVIEASGYQLLLGNTQYDLGREYTLLQAMLGWSPPGLIVAGLRHDARTQAILRGFGRPVIEIMELGRGAIDCNVGLSHYRAGALIAQHLAGRGYRRIRFVGARLARDYRARQRMTGCHRTLAALGIEVGKPFNLDADSSTSAGGDALIDVLAAAPETDALFMANDDLAVGAILRARREGIDIPGRVAIAGFNGLPLGAEVMPALTTVTSPRLRIGRLAGELLLDRIAGRAAPHQRIDVGVELTVRHST